MTKTEINKTKTALKQVKGIYAKRVASTKKAFLKKQEYHNIVDDADNQKLAKMLRILGFLTQTKVYLLWKQN